MERANILVVEDESIVATDIRLTLESMGYEVCGIASEGERAVELARRERPDLVLMDIVLRGEMDGIRAAHEIDDRFGIPSIFLTAYSDSHFVERAAKTSPAIFILKPWDDRQLKTNIELALAHARFRRDLESEPYRIFNHLPAPYQSLDGEGRLIVANTAWFGLLDYPRDDAIGKPFETFVMPEDRSQFRRCLKTLRNQGYVLHAPLNLRKSDGTAVPVQLTGRLGADSDGETERAHCMIADVTRFLDQADELRRAKERSEEISRAKSQFIASFSHELRTPLTSILGFSEIIANEVLGPIGTGRYREYARDIHDSGEHLLELIDDILDLSKIEAGRFEISDETVDLVEIVETTRRMIQPRLTEKNQSFELTAPPSGAHIRADRRSVLQMVLNIVGNAVKFTPPHGEIHVVINRDVDRGVTVRVIDTGIGIPPQDVLRVLEPYRRSDTAAVKIEKGTGLGLAVVKSLIELHGGRIEVSSMVNRGTTVSLVFPRERAIAGEPD